MDTRSSIAFNFSGHGLPDVCVAQGPYYGGDVIIESAITIVQGDTRIVVPQDDFLELLTIAKEWASSVLD